jgi:hypothetical protein
VVQFGCTVAAASCVEGEEISSACGRGLPVLLDASAAATTSSCPDIFAGLFRPREGQQRDSYALLRRSCTELSENHWDFQTFFRMQFNRALSPQKCRTN